MKLIYKGFSTLLLAILLLSIVTPVALAESQGSGKIDTVLINRSGDTVISISFSDYNKAIKTKNEYYNYLKGTKDSIEIFGISSGEKYIVMGEYNKQYKLNKRNTEQAINNSAEIETSIIGTFNKLVGFDETGDPILVPITEVPSVLFRVLDIY